MLVPMSAGEAGGIDDASRRYAEPSSGPDLEGDDGMLDEDAE